LVNLSWTWKGDTSSSYYGNSVVRQGINPLNVRRRR